MRSARRSVRLNRGQVQLLLAEGVLPPSVAGPLARVLGLEGPYPIRLGNVIAVFTHALGLPFCDGCARRRHWLNKVIVWGWWRGR